MKLYTWRLLGLPSPLQVKDKNGKENSPYRVYRIWKNMKKRCGEICRKSFPKVRQAQYYVNVKLCEDWRSFVNFYRWAMSHGYRDDLTIDRIDNEKGYSPDNCRWVTLSEQNKNRRMTDKWRAHLFEIRRKQMLMRQARRNAEKERGKCCVASR